MRSLSNVGIGLSLVFGCLLLALIAELYYLLWWKKRITNREIEDHNYTSPAREFLYMFCFKKPSSSSSSLSSTIALNPQHLCSFTGTQVLEPQAQLHSNKDMWLKQFGGQEEDGADDTELSRLQNLSVPPRFLFTINEETKEDLESENDKSRKGSRSRSLSDLVLTVETPFLTPLDSPSYFTPPLTPRDSSYSENGFNPLFESSSDAEFNRIRSSPPPKFKFLRDAEEKLHKTKVMEEGESDEEENESFITLIVDKNRDGEVNHHPNLYSSTSSQVLPLAASPPTFRPSSPKNPILH
ncbi:hypothetical protein LguiA_023670 [Lonicera macranthoides]